MKSIPFRFEGAWTIDPNCKGVVDQAWNMNIRGAATFRFSGKVKKTKVALRDQTKKSSRTVIREYKKH